MHILYHYTSKEGYDAILASQVLQPSLKANNPKDARYGDGQYLSDILPGTKRPGQLSYIFLNIPFQGKQFTHYIGIVVTGLTVVKGRDYVFVVLNVGPLSLSGILASHGENR